MGAVPSVTTPYTVAAEADAGGNSRSMFASCRPWITKLSLYCKLSRSCLISAINNPPENHEDVDRSVPRTGQPIKNPTQPETKSRNCTTAAEAASDCAKAGGDRFDDAIIRHLRRKHNLLIGERTAEELKINIGSAIPRSEQLYMEVTGRNLITGLPKTMRITSDDITEAIDEPLQQLIESIHGVLEHTPAELAADIFEYGILLSGGGAEMFGLCEAIADALKVPCSCAEDPQTNVVMGCGRALENMHDLGQFLDDGRRRLMGR